MKDNRLLKNKDDINMQARDVLPTKLLVIKSFVILCHKN